MEKNSIVSSVQKDECCGCGACINVCPVKALKYETDQYGFIIPAIDNEKCIMCGKCVSVCPVLDCKKRLPIRAYAAKTLDDRLCLKSSSGGIFGSIAKYILEKEGVVYGCTMDRNFTVKHIRIDCFDDLEKIMRSKYVQSHMGDIYRQIEEELKKNRIVMFSGTPCQVAAVNNYIPDKYKEKLFTIDVVCHGVPSQIFFDSYLKGLEKGAGIIEEYIFRYKKTVNNGMNCYFAYRLKASKKLKICNWPEDIFNFLYMKAYIYRESCYKCKFATIERTGDITLCDYWSWEKYHNQFSLGNTVSGVIINSAKAEEIVEQLSDKIDFIETKIDDIKDNNSCLIKPSKLPLKRNEVLEFWKQQGMEELNRLFKKKNKKNILKYSLMRKIPPPVMNILLKLRLKVIRG